MSACTFCGVRTETPCETPPPDTCEHALNTTARDTQARALYDACVTPKPAWDDLGDVTKSVWRDYVKLGVRTDPCAQCAALGTHACPKHGVLA